MSDTDGLTRFGKLLTGLLSQAGGSWSVTESGDPFHPALVIAMVVPVSDDTRAQIRDLIAENVSAATRPSIIYQPADEP